MVEKSFEELMQRFREITFHETFDMIVAIANGGIVPAAIINQRLNTFRNFHGVLVPYLHRRWNHLVELQLSLSRVTPVCWSQVRYSIGEGPQIGVASSSAAVITQIVRFVTVGKPIHVGLLKC